MSEAISNRYDFVMFFDVENGNPNGNPDAGNAPRVDAETGHGYVTDVCLKRKIRNYVEIAMEGVPGYNILIKADRALNTKFTEAYGAEGLSGKGRRVSEAERAREYMCRNYYDVRTFGAVMSTGSNPCGIVRGPVQLGFARSVSPVSIQEISIIRQAVTTEKDFMVKSGVMGCKSIIPYGLYRGEGYVSANIAQKSTGFSEDDLELLWTSVINMFEEDHSASRGKMCMRRLYVFKHDGILGNYPSNGLFEKIAVREKNPGKVPRSFDDYVITVDDAMPNGVTLIRKL